MKLPEGFNPGRSLPREYGEHVASMVQDRAEVRLLHGRDGVILTIQHEGSNWIQLLPDHAGEDNPRGLFFNENEAREALKEWCKPIPPPDPTHCCACCKRNWVDSDNGYDTCEECLSKI